MKKLKLDEKYILHCYDCNPLIKLECERIHPTFVMGNLLGRVVWGWGRQGEREGVENYEQA